MDQKEFLNGLHFTENPFQFTNADEEEHLQTYFVPPPYFGSVWGDPDHPASQVIFAPRGGGKSAQRKMVEYRAQRENVFALTYDRFEPLGGLDLATLGLEYHLRNIIELTLLGFLLEYHTRRLQAPAFTTCEREQLAQLCRHYLGKINRLEALNALKSLRTLSSAAKDFLQTWTGPVNALVSAALASQGLPGIAVGAPSAADRSDGGIGGPTKAHFEAAVRFVRSIGFKSIYVLVDKVDETAATGNNAESSFLLVKSMLCDLELLQSRDVGFKFFLWDKIEPHYREYARPDRLQQFSLSWTGDQVKEMLSRRLAAFSDGKITDLGQLTEEDFASPLQSLAVWFANGSPRDMVRFCQEIVSEQLQLGPQSSNFHVDAIVKGVSTFSARRAKELLPTQVLSELTKVGRVDFTTNYIANEVFKIETNSARNKIVQWTKTGAIEKVAELRTGGRPVYQYAITDIRVAKATLPQMNLAEFLRTKIRVCDKCRILLIRDWDRQQTQTCHKCGSDMKGAA